MQYQQYETLKSYANEVGDAATVLAHLHAHDAQKSAIIRDVQKQGVSSGEFYRFSRLCILTLCDKNQELTPQQSRALINGSLGASTYLYAQMVSGTSLTFNTQAQVKPKDAKNQAFRNYPPSMTKAQCFKLFSRIEESGLLPDYGDFFDKQSGSLWTKDGAPRMAPPFPKPLQDNFGKWLKNRPSPSSKPAHIRRVHVENLLPIGYSENEGLRGAFDKTKKREGGAVTSPAEKRDEWLEASLLARNDINWDETVIYDDPHVQGARERDQYTFFHIVKNNGEITQAAVCNRPANSQDHSNASLIWKGERISIDEIDDITIQKIKARIAPRPIHCRSKDYLTRTLNELIDADEIPPYKIKRMEWKAQNAQEAIDQTILSYYQEYQNPPTSDSGFVDHDGAHDVHKGKTDWNNISSAINRGLVPTIKEVKFMGYVQKVIAEHENKAAAPPPPLGPEIT